MTRLLWQTQGQKQGQRVRRASWELGRFQFPEPPHITPHPKGLSSHLFTSDGRIKRRVLSTLDSLYVDIYCCRAQTYTSNSNQVYVMSAKSIGLRDGQV